MSSTFFSIGLFALSKPIKTSQTYTTPSKISLTQNSNPISDTTISVDAKLDTASSDTVNKTETTFEPVEAKSEVLLLAFEDNSDVASCAILNSSQVNNPNSDDLVEAKQQTMPDDDASSYLIDPAINIAIEEAKFQALQAELNRYVVDPSEQLAQDDRQVPVSDPLNSTYHNHPMAEPHYTDNYHPPNQVANTTQYHYNGVGHLVGKTVDGVKTDFTLDTVNGLPEVIYTSEGNAYIHLPGVIVAEKANGERRYLLPDGQGTIRQAVDENRNVVANYDFDPYGNPLSESGGEPYGYTGEWWEKDVELLHLRARWYMPEIGRFISKDPSGLEQNPYEYAKSNPIRNVDPSGYLFVTFDDGPVTNDAQILDILRRHNAHATFFFHGNEVDLLNPLDVEVVWRVAAEGHRLGNHSFEHTDLRNECMMDVAASLRSTEGKLRAALLQVKTFQPGRYQGLPPLERNYVDNIIDKGTGLFRPPGGDLTANQRFQIECMEVVYAPLGGSFPIQGECKQGIPGPYNVSWWTVDPWDWAIDNMVEEPDSNLSLSQGADSIYNRTVGGRYRTLNVWGIDIPIGQIATPFLGSSSLGSHGIRSNSDNILLHSDSEPTVEALDRILQWVKNQGYTFDLVEPSWSSK